MHSGLDKIDPEIKCHGGRRDGSGRKSGTPNKVTASVKAAILEAFEKLGGVDYLVKVGQEDPKTFLALVGKVLPTQIEPSEETSGELVISWIMNDLNGRTRRLPSEKPAAASASERQSDG